MNVSVIIPTYNHLEDCLKPCLESLIRNTTLNDNIEVFVVGNGCTDGTKEYMDMLNKQYPAIKYLDYPEPLGYAKANNRALEIATGDYLLLLNNDVVLLDWGKDVWINMLIEPFLANPKCGITGPSLGYSHPADANFLIFFCVMISRKCFNAVGYLDEQFKEGGGEDTAYCIEAVRKGFEQIQVPPTSLWVQKDYMVGPYPIYHAGEKTVHGLKDWDNIFKRNSDILTRKYNRRWILSEEGERNIYGKGHQPDILEDKRYRWARENIIGNKILEIGCSSGYGTQYLKDIPDLNYLGIDRYNDVIDYASENFGDIPGVKFKRADINEFEFEQYDTIIAFEVLEHVEKGREIAQKLKQHCKRLLISTPYDEDPNNNPHHKLFNLTEKDFPGFNYGLINFENDGLIETTMSNKKELNLFILKWTRPEQTEVKPTVTAVISTKNRHKTTLPLTLMAITNQTVKPNHLIIYDDGDFKPGLDKDPIYSKIFTTVSAVGISWEYKYGKRIGQVANYIQSLTDANTEFIWRLDDDNIPEHNVLEGLLKNVSTDVGAVGGLVINSYSNVPSTASNKIEDIYLGLNEQWFFHPEGSPAKEVDHLYSSFIYRRSIAQYSDNLSPVGHREETILTYEMKRKGFKIILEPKVKTWHFENPEGGIRSSSDKHENALKDEQIFTNKMIEWNIIKKQFKHIVLENGIGDHYAFKYSLPEIMEQNKDKEIIIYAVYPDVFKDVKGIRLESIAAAKSLFGSIDDFNIYKWMIDHNWKTNIYSAYRQMYKLKPKELPTVVNGSGNYIVISPYSNIVDHPKNYPYWEKLIEELNKSGLDIIQIGRSSELRLKGVKDFKTDLPFSEIEQLIKGSRCWVGVDNFLQHFVNCMDTPIKGCVIWGQSDPFLFGYKYNLNLLMTRNNLRPDQFNVWFNVPIKNTVFYSPDTVFNYLTQDLLTPYTN